MAKHLSYFVSDVHLGLQVKDPEGRERRFVDFLRSLDPSETECLFLMGDIFDFWYEYRDVVPKGYARLFATLQDLMDSGVEVCFFRGNHDIWSYHYFEDMGMRRLEQPYETTLGGKVFCIGHGDGLGPVPKSYMLMKSVFTNRVAQTLFSTLHPWFAFRLGYGWSRHNRLSHNEEYKFNGEKEPLLAFAREYASSHKVDYFIFGHYHASVDMMLESGSRFLMLKDWMDQSPYAVFDSETGDARLCLYAG